jgi:hypothetical protein
MFDKHSYFEVMLIGNICRWMGVVPDVSFCNDLTMVFRGASHPLRC